MPYSACIFDLDGTLADTLHSIAHFGNGTLEAFGYPPIDPIEYKHLVGNGADLLMRRMLARVGAKLSEEELKRFRAEYDRRIGWRIRRAGRCRQIGRASCRKECT